VNEQAVYVYGVAPAGACRRISTRGVEAARVRTIEHADLAALVSDLHGDALTAAREVRAHWRVLDEASESCTVLPVRFGTVMDEDDAVREQLLEPGGEQLVALLRELDGRIQLTLKADYDERQLMRDVLQESQAVFTLRERLRSVPAEAGYFERIRLGEMVADQVAHRRAEDTRIAIETLEPLAVAMREEQVTHTDAAFNLSFLVDRNRQEEFNKGVRALAEKLGDRVDLRYVGPLPPYSFADIELDTEAAAWA
jgi:Gas vesicle synthesis protein GvpL/GvpF